MAVVLTDRIELGDRYLARKQRLVLSDVVAGQDLSRCT